MNFDEARVQLKPRLKDYVATVTKKSKGGMYVCPLCGSGTGKSGTGAFSIDPKAPTRWKCFSCGKGGDIFDLIGEVEHIQEPMEQLRRAADLYGVDLDQKQPKTERDTRTRAPATVQQKPVEEDYGDYFAECSKHLVETDYLYRRGISEGTARRYGLGYDSHYKRGTGGATWGALIIPTGPKSFVARNTDPQAGKNDRYRKAGAVPFNHAALHEAQQPIFIVEGELDALSIIEAGGEAIALGSTSYVDIFVRGYIKGKKPPAQPLVIALDNDSEGQAAADKLAAALEELGISSYRQDPYNGHKDANEALLADRAAFAQTIAQAAAQAADREQEALDAEKAEYLATSACSHLNEFLDGIQEGANTPATPTGFTLLDYTLDGGLYEGLYVLGAGTSLGKTTFALQIADQIAYSGRDVLIFSLEMARTELMAKSISRGTVIIAKNAGKKSTLYSTSDAKTNRQITAGAKYKDYSERERRLIYQAACAYGGYAQHIFIHEGIGDIGVDDVRAAVQKHVRLTGNSPVVLVDYLQILAPYDVRATDKQNTDKSVLELKRISRDFKIPVIAISSLNRVGYHGKVDLAAFKESGAIEYGSDVLMGLQAQDADKEDFTDDRTRGQTVREMELSILKNRNGRTTGEGRGIQYTFYALFNYFEERNTSGSIWDNLR